MKTLLLCVRRSQPGEDPNREPLGNLSSSTLHAAMFQYYEDAEESYQVPRVTKSGKYHRRPFSSRNKAWQHGLSFITSNCFVCINNLVCLETSEINTGCPILLGPLCFCYFLGFWSTYRGTFHSHWIAHEILIPKLTLLSILCEKLTKLQHKT